MLRVNSFLQLIQAFPTYALARWYVHACGFSVLPLKPRSKQRLFAGTVFQTWMPRDDQLRKWFCTKQPYNVAIVPGEVSGNLVILDFDVIEVFQVWISLVPGAYDLPCVRSARGVHVYIRLKALPQGGKGIFDGLVFGDILTRGAITAPPSLHPSGHQYTWEGDPRHVPLFSCLADLGIEKPPPIRVPATVQRTRIKSISSIRGIGNQVAYAQAAVRYEGQKIVQIGKGKRNMQLYQSALKLSKYLDILTETYLEQELIHWAEAAGMHEGPDDVIRDTILSGFRNGCQHGVIRRRV